MQHEDVLVVEQHDHVVHVQHVVSSQVGADRSSRLGVTRHRVSMVTTSSLTEGASSASGFSLLRYSEMHSLTGLVPAWFGSGKET